MAENVVRLPQQAASDPFSQLWEMGFKRLCPIIPPGAPIGEKSNLFERLAKGDDARGKAPGVRWPDGTWSGFDWRASDPDERDLQRWAQMGAGVGIKTGEGVVLIDADTLHEDRAAIIKAEVEAMFGPLPIRIGQYPKAGYALGLDGPCPYLRVEFGELNAKGSLTERVEVLSEGRQFVAYGVHPKTKAPYRWASKLLPLDQLPRATEEQIRELLRRIAAKLPAATPVKSEGSRSEVDQSSLRGDLAIVQKAVRATPNTSALFPTREDYRDFGYAIKASLPDHPDEALDLFQEWCAKWSGGVNEPEIVEADWRRMKPPFRRGASWLFDLAESTSAGGFSRAELWFEPILDTASIFAEEPVAELELTEDGAECDDDAPIVAPPMLVKRLVPKDGICFIGGQSGAGKTFILCDMAVSLASGADFFRHRVREKVGVVILAGEGLSTIKRRIRAARSVKSGDDALPIRWWGDIPNLKEKTGFDATVRRLRASAKIFREKYGVRLGAVFLDTVAACFAMKDENDNSEATEVTKILAALGRAVGCVVIPVHHYGKGQETGLRGASAWRGNVDAVLSVTCNRNQVTGATSGHFLSLAKTRDGEEGAVAPFALKSFSLGTDEDGEAITTCYVAPGEAVAALQEVGGDLTAMSGGDVAAVSKEAACLSEMSLQKLRANPDKNGGAWVGQVIARHFGADLATAFGRKQVKNLLRKWEAEGKTKTEKGWSASGNATTYVETVVQAVHSGLQEAASDLFEGLF